MGRKIFNLERDIRTTDRIVYRIRRDEIYAQNWYAALCNNSFIPQDVWGILTNINWTCSWRYAAEMISDIRQDESYKEWYGSGTGFRGIDFCGFVEESFITEQIDQDITSIGWCVPVRLYTYFPD